MDGAADIIVGDGHRRGLVGAEAGPAGRECQGHLEGLVRIDDRVVDDWDFNGLAGLAIGEDQNARGRRVVGFRQCRAIAGGIGHRHTAGGAAGAADGSFLENPNIYNIHNISELC